MLNDLNDSSIVQRQRQIFYHSQKFIVSNHLNKEIWVVGSVNVPCAEDLLPARVVIYYSNLTVQLRQFGSLVMSHVLLEWAARRSATSLTFLFP